MSPNKLDRTGAFCTPHIESVLHPGLDIQASDVRIYENGLEFRSHCPVSLWTEMKVDICSPLDGRKFNCTGVVVECRGTRHSEFRVLLSFVNLTPPVRRNLSSFAFGSAA